jgi:hypothetical protein
MAYQIISLSPDELLDAIESAIETLRYPSETDAILEVELIPASEAGETFTGLDLEQLYYSEVDGLHAETMEWAEANRLESNGTQRFFRDLTDVITTYPNNEFWVQEQYHRDQTPHWRELRDLFFDNLVHQRWFRFDLAEPFDARSDIYLVGRHLQIEMDSDTNEIRTQLLDWVLVKTFVIET